MKQKQKRYLWGWMTLVLLASFWLAPAVNAQEPTQDEVNAVARKLFCPVCENTPLDVCPTQACQNWRDEIRVSLAAGASEEEILDDFARKYGDSVLAEPPPQQWAAWGLPVVIVVVAAAALVYWLRSWTRPAPAVVPAAVIDDDALDKTDPYLEKLEQELAEWES